jgi:hypothetical protein
MFTFATHQEPANLISVDFESEMTAEDYFELIPKLELQFKKHDKLRVLFDMSDVGDVEIDAVWQDLKSDIKHREDYEKIALVGDKQWHHWGAQAFKPFMKAEVEYFDEDNKEEAIEWVKD